MNGSQQHQSAAMPATPEDGNTQRGSGGSGSGRPGGSSRSRQNVQIQYNTSWQVYDANTEQPQQQLSTIEKSVTHLLVATKQLLETLTMWSTARATEGEVSDVYVRLGYEFNIACRAFSAIGVDTSDLGPVPDMLRGILEETLSQEASQASLEKYLPRIRDIIINLLHGLKKKQQRLRQRSNREGGGGGESSGRPPRHASTASTMSVATNLTEQLEDIPSRASSSRSFLQRQGSGDLSGPELPPRTTSAAPGGRTSPKRHELSPQNSVNQGMARGDSSSTMSSNTMQNIPVIAPYPESETMPTNQGYEHDQQSSPEPPKPPPKANDALSALQRGGDLERRASRRFSAYQIQKHLGTSINGIPAIPPAQNSPIPNRGRDLRESMNAVRSRGSIMHSRARSKNQKTTFEVSPNREHEVRRISEEASSQQEEETPQPPSMPYTNDDSGNYSPIVKTPEDKLAPPFSPPRDDDSVGATLNGPIEEPFTPGGTFGDLERTPTLKQKRDKSVREARDFTPPVSQYLPESSPQPGKELTLFLQYKSKVKKFVLPDGGDLSLARLQLAFIEKFAWNTHNNGVDLPEIYIQDQVSGVRHELEDLTDIKERSVLVLNVEPLDEVKRHFDDGLGSLRRLVEGISSSVADQSSALQRVSDRQQEAAKEIASLAAAPPAATTSSSGPISAPRSSSGQLKEVQALRRDLAVVRQTYNSFVSDMQGSMSTIRSKAASVKKAAADAAIPTMDTSTGRGYVDKGKKQLSDDSERIVNRVDDLQDHVEDLRKDVVVRGVRPLPRQLEQTSKDISTATSELKKMQEFLRREKPVWTKIWEKELQVVCEERDLLTMQEELAADLEDDLLKAEQTFSLVEEATKQQNLHNPTGSAQGSRSASANLRPIAMDQGADPHKAKDSVLGEVRALQPNHESRLEAIERAEKARRRELENRQGGEFQRELGNFVEEGKLKKSGGVEEVERVRKLREEQTRKEVYERQQQRAKELEEKRAAEAAAQAQAAAAGEGEEAATNGEHAEPANDESDVKTAEGLQVPPIPESERESPDVGFEDAKEDLDPAPSATDPPAP